MVQEESSFLPRENPPPVVRKREGKASFSDFLLRIIRKRGRNAKPEEQQLRHTKTEALEALGTHDKGALFQEG